MKKLLGISLVAIMSVSAANAEIASRAYVDQQDGDLTTLTTSVKTSLVGAINELNTKAGDTSVADQIAEALEAYTETGEDENYAPANVLDSLNYTSTGDGVVTAVSQSNGAVSATKAKITNTEIADNAAIAQSKIDGLTTALDAKADAADLGALAAKSEVAKADLASALAAEIDGKADSATTLAGYGIADAYTKTETDGAIDTAIDELNLANTYQAKGDYATAAQGALADTAVQPAAISDMQVKANLVTSMSGSSTDTQYPSAKAVYTAVEAAKTAASSDLTALTTKVTANETAISTINSSAPMTSGITSEKVGQYDALVTDAASYGDIVTHDADEFATAAQGLKADSAVQSVTKSGTGNILTDITTTGDAVTVTVSGTAIPQPSGNCADCVLHYNGTAYSWEEIAR